MSRGLIPLILTSLSPASKPSSSPIEPGSTDSITAGLIKPMPDFLFGIGTPTSVVVSFHTD